MSFLDIFFLFSAIGILVYSIRLAKKDHFQWLHFVIFLLGGIGLLIFTFFPHIRHQIALFFGVERGADALVYMSVIILFYFVLLLLYRSESQRQQMTALVREIALLESQKNEK